MRLITIPKASVTFENGVSLMDPATGGRKPVVETKTFFDFLIEVIDATVEFGRGGAKAARRQKKILDAMDMAEAGKNDILRLEDSDYDEMRKAHMGMQRQPAKARAMLEFFEAFETAQEEKGPA